MDMPEGLKLKYIIHKADGTPVNPDADYFVLRLDKHDAYGAASRKAATMYADAVVEHNPQLAADLLCRVLNYEGKARMGLIVQAIGKQAGAFARARAKGVARFCDALAEESTAETD